MAASFHREYLVRLPLPLAQLYSRAYNAKDGRSRHDNTFYLCEALVKLAAAPVIAAYLQETQDGAARNPALDRLLAQLALPSLGQWVGILRELARHFGTRTDAPSHPLGHLWEQLDTRGRERRGLVQLYQQIKNGPDNPPGGDESCSLLQIFDALVQYRNGVFGHGGPRFESFYAERMGPLLFPAVNELLAEGTFDLLGPPGSRLVYITELRTLAEDKVEVGLRELIGLQGERLPPVELSTSHAAALLPNRVAVLWPGRRALLRLDPLLQYRESETAEELLFLNRDRNGRSAEYLSYTTGRTERDREAAASLSALLSRVTGRSVTEADLEALAQGSLAEMPSLERITGTQPPAARVMGDYEILAEIGRGGMGVVYLARQRSLGRLVALKMLPADLEGDDLALARFRREVRHLARCEHPNIVKVLSSGTMPDGQLFYSMEYVPGCDLEQVWRELSGPAGASSASALRQSTWEEAVLSASRKRQKEAAERSASGQKSAQPGHSADEMDSPPKLALPPLPELPSASDAPGSYVRRVAQMIHDAALALETVHGQELVHRDVKPANLMLTPDGSRVVLMDFGLAKGQSMALTATGSGGFLGTLRYAAPEQLAAARIQVGPAADVRGLGCVLWELLTRRRLFGEAQDEIELAQMVHDGDVPRLRTIDPSLDRDIEALVARATERRTADRIPTATRLAEYLQLYLEGKPLPIRTPGPVELLQRWARQHKAHLAGAAVGLAAVIVAVIVSFVLINRAKNEAVWLAERNAELADAEAVARKKAEEQEEETRKAAFGVHRLLYLTHMREIEPFWRAGNVAAVEERLAPYAQPKEGWPDPRGWEWHYQWRLSHPEQRMIPTGSDRVESLAIDSRGQRLAGVVSKTIQIWDSGSGERLHVIAAHDDWIRNLALSPDGRLLASVSDDKTVKLWDAETGRLRHQFAFEVNLGESLVFSRDGRWITFPIPRDTIPEKGHGIPLYDTTTGKVIRRLGEEGNESIAISPDGKLLASLVSRVGPYARTVQLWDVEAGKRLATLEGHLLFDRVAFSPDGTLVACSEFSDNVRIWDVRTYESVTLLPQGHYGDISFAFSPDSRQMATASEREFHLWNIPSGELAHTFIRTGKFWGEPESLFFTADGRQLIHVSDALRVWNVAGRRLQEEEHAASISSLIPAPDGRFVISGGQDGSIRFWDTAMFGTRSFSLGKEPNVLALGYGLRGPLLVFGEPSRLRIWNGATRQITTIARDFRRLQGRMVDSDTYQSAVILSPDGRFLATLEEKPANPNIRLWDVQTGQLAHELVNSELSGFPDFSPDGNWLVNAEFKRMNVWNTQTGDRVAIIPAAEGEAYLDVLAFSPNSDRLALGSGKNILIYRTEDGQLIHKLPEQEVPSDFAEFSTDGRRLVSDGLYNQLKVWDLDSGQLLHTLKTNGRVTYGNVAFSPDGATIAVGVNSSAVELWSARTGQLLQVLRMEASSKGVGGLHFTTDGQRIFLGNFLWDIATGQVLRTLETDAVRPSANGVRLLCTRDGKAEILDARPKTRATDVEDEALGLLRSLFNRPLAKKDVLRAVKESKTIASDVRQRALELVDWFNDQPVDAGADDSSVVAPMEAGN